MEAKAIVKNIRISPRKVSIVMDLIRGKNTDVAMGILKNTRKAACEPLLKLLRSAMANAENNHSMDPENLFIKQIHVGPGPILKRIMPRAQGSAFRINKRTSHVTLVLGDKE